MKTTPERGTKVLHKNGKTYLSLGGGSFVELRNGEWHGPIRYLNLDSLKPAEAA